MKIFGYAVLFTLCLFLAVPVSADETSAPNYVATKKSASKKKVPLGSLWAQSYRLEKKRRYADAARVIAPFRTRGPDMEFAILRTAWLEYLQGRYNAAIRDYYTAIELNPHSIDARLGITLPLMAQKRWRETRDYLNGVLKYAPWNYTAHLRLLITNEAQRKWQRLANQAQSLSLRYPNDTSALVYLARAYAWQYKKARAKAVYARVLARIPGHLEASYYFKNN